ncbi:MAG: MBL fold metallo-hydrolase [Phycisphaerales bacterium]
MLFRRIEDSKLAQYAYLIGCQKTGEAIVFDPERDIDRYIEAAAREGLKIVAAAETHIHADFLSGARELAERVGAHVYVGGEGGPDWQSRWAKPYKHTLLKDGDTFKIGNIRFKAMHTPGHTPEHVSYLVYDAVGGNEVPIGLLTGDFVFVGDLGRPDLLESAAGMKGIAEPSAHQLFRSVQKLQSVPDYVQVWPAHGAGSACGKALGAVPQSTIGYEKAVSHALKLRGDEAAFVKDILSGQPEPPPYFARMKALNRDGVPVLGKLPVPEVVTDLRTRAAEWEKPGTVVLDTRPWAAFRDGHLPGALTLPLGKMLPMVLGSYVKPEERIVLVCEPAMAEELVRDFVRIGYDHIVAVVPPSAVAAAPRLEKTPEMTVEQAQAAMADAAVLDVRGATEFEAGAIEGAHNLPYTRLMPRLAEVPRGGRVLVHCALGGRSAAATAMLRRLGYDAVNVAGGFEAWKRAGLATIVPTPVGAGASCCGGGGCCG